MSSSNHNLKAEAAKVLDQYIDNFNKGELHKAAAIYHNPTMKITQETVELIHGPEDLYKYLVDTTKSLEEENWDHAEWVGPRKEIVLDNKGLVLACRNGTRFRKDGSTILNFTVTYTLRKADNQDWQIVAYHLHPVGIHTPWE